MRFQMIESVMHGKVLNVEGHRTNPGTPIILWHKEGGPPPNELWCFEFAYGDQFWIVSALSPNLVLDVEGGRGDPGAKIILYPRQYPPASNQLWRWSGENIETCLGGVLVLDVAGEDHCNGARVCVWNRKYGGNNSNQSWRVA